MSSSLSTTVTLDYPVHLLVYPARLAYDNACTSSLLKDEYVFATFLSIFLQGFKFEENGGSDEDLLANILESTIPNYVFDADEHDIDKSDRLMEVVNQLRSQFNESVTTTYVKDFLLAIAVYRSLMLKRKHFTETQQILSNLISKMVKVMIDRQKGKSSITMNLERLMNVMDLTSGETRLIEMNYFFSTDIRTTIFRNFFFGFIKDTSLHDHAYKIMIGADSTDLKSQNEITAALAETSKPITLGIVSYDLKSRRMGGLSEFWVFAIANYAETDEKFFERFIEEVKEKKRTFSGAIAKILPRDNELFKQFLNTALEVSAEADMVTSLEMFKSNKRDMTEKEKLGVDVVDEIIQNGQESLDLSKGLNSLLYGSRRLDKMGYIQDVLKEKQLTGWQLNLKGCRSCDIPSICYVAQQHLFKTKNQVVLIIDKAEQALTRQSTKPTWFYDVFGDSDGGRDSKPVDDLTSDEILLINNRIPTVWLAVSPSEITPENVGRFLFHAELKGGSRKDRSGEIEKVVAELGFSNEISQKLAKYLELNVEQIKSAAKLIKMLKLDGEAGEEALLHLITNSQKAMDRTKQEQLRTSVTKYDTGLLNIGGNISIDKILDALKKKPKGGICLFGAPGTGKTQLAEYIAVQLDMPLIIKPASELLNMYIGETEKNIAKAFEEAKSEGAIFLLDEADSFLRDRAMAHRSWEVTMVNELLMRMERFTENGIFICATNLMTMIDAAALRRFTFKLEFKPLTYEQRFRMLENECPEVAMLNEAQRMDLQIDLQLIKYLTPGDFAVVKRQADLMSETLTIKDWLTRLTVEAKAKLVGIERGGYATTEEGPDVIHKTRTGA